MANIASHTLLLFSDAIGSCKSDAQRDYSSGSTRIDILESSARREGEAVGDHFARLVNLFTGDCLSKYDGVLIAGDRYENLALATRCFFERIPVIHFFGGDVSYGGHFDDHLRHAISHLASIHFPVNNTARENLLKMNEEPTRVIHLGSPVVDEIAAVSQGISKKYAWNIILSFNPMTLGPPDAVPASLRATLDAIDDLSRTMIIKCLATRPNNEPGSREINSLLDSYSDHDWLEVVDSLGSPAYLHAIKSASVVVGNSSSQLLEVPVLGTHSLLIGDRQRGRHSPVTVSFLPGTPTKEEIQGKMRILLDSPRPVPCVDYGKEGVTDAILSVINRLMRLSRTTLASKSTPLNMEGGE
jgi:UDP-hydrolysing UDP-N-acetyl-D-glucosamine 2-epimerase